MNEEMTREELELAEAGEEMLEAEEATLGGIYKDELNADAPLSISRGIAVITEEIIFYKTVGGQAAIEIGKRLIEAKAQLKHGEWLPWLSEKVEFSEATAQRFMQLARGYENPAPVRDLGVSKALQLLALPASEREEFIAEKHEVNGEEKSVSEMTKKELEQAIRERDEARKELKDAKDELAETSELLDKKTDEYAALSVVAKELQDNVEEAEKRIDELESRPVEVAVQERDASPEQIEAAKAEARAEALAESEKAHAAEIAELKSNKDAEVQRADKLAEEKKKLTEKLKAAEEKAKASASAGTAETEKLTAEIAELRKQLSMSGAEMTAFKIKFSEWQEAYNAMKFALDCLAPEQREKCEAAIRAVLEGWK